MHSPKIVYRKGRKENILVFQEENGFALFASLR
jgi:hypothetical protein